jgi:PilZ domain
VTDPCTIIIGAADFLPALKERAAAINGEVIAFADGDALRALETIHKRKPNVVALHRLFAVSPRGAALINRIKADPALRLSEIRVLEHNSDYSRIIPRQVAAAPAAPALDSGTRRAPRIKIREKVTVLVDMRPATLVDLSLVGAQIIATSSLKLDQRTEVAFSDSVEKIKCAATVIWATFDMSTGTPRFRAGLDFIDPASGPIGAYAQRHKA